MALITLKLFDLRRINEAHRYLEFLANGAYDRTENENKEKFVLKLFVAFVVLPFNLIYYCSRKSIARHI